MEYSRMFENENLEFKEMVPEDFLKYTKTVVGFANGNGGLLVFGIRDSDHAVIGIPDDQLFVTIDRITNAISDSIEPLPDFSVSIMQENNRNLIAVETRGVPVDHITSDPWAMRMALSSVSGEQQNSQKRNLYPNGILKSAMSVGTLWSILLMKLGSLRCKPSKRPAGTRFLIL